MKHKNDGVCEFLVVFWGCLCDKNMIFGLFHITVTNMNFEWNYYVLETFQHLSFFENKRAFTSSIYFEISCRYLVFLKIYIFSSMKKFRFWKTSEIFTRYLGKNRQCNGSLCHFLKLSNFLKICQLVILILLILFDYFASRPLVLGLLAACCTDIVLARL